MQANNTGSANCSFESILRTAKKNPKTNLYFFAPALGMPNWNEEPESLKFKRYPNLCQKVLSHGSTHLTILKSNSLLVHDSQGTATIIHHVSPYPSCFCSRAKWNFLSPSSLWAKTLTGHICSALVPPSDPPSCHLLRFKKLFSPPPGCSVWPQLPLTLTFVWRQPINRTYYGRVSDVEPANWNLQRATADDNEHFFRHMCVSEWWMRSIENLPHSHGDRLSWAFVGNAKRPQNNPDNRSNELLRCD